MIDFKLLVAHNYLENLDVIINNSLGFSHLSQFGSNKNMRPPCSARGKCFPKRQGTWAILFSSKPFHCFDINQSFWELFKNIDCHFLSGKLWKNLSDCKPTFSRRKLFREINFSKKVDFMVFFFLDFNESSTGLPELLPNCPEELLRFTPTWQVSEKNSTY